MYDGVDFKIIQEDFYKEWEGKEYRKGTGYKQFKRWEYFMEPRTYPDKKSIPATQLWDEYLKLEERRSGATCSLDWSPVGPQNWVDGNGWNPGNGRVNIVVEDPNDTNTIYIGVPSGGCWKSTDGGISWTCLTDNMPVLGVSGIAIDPTNSNIVYIGTGDGDGSDTYSIGVLKSTDGGITWNTTGLSWTNPFWVVVRRLILDPTNPNILFCATSNGLYKTTDAGANWTNVQGGSLQDVELHPTNSNIVYTAGNAFYKSTNGGSTFSQITSGLPASSSVNRFKIAVSPNQPDYVFALAGKSSDGTFLGLYRSTNSGASFVTRTSSPNMFGYASDGSDTGGQSSYDMALAVDPNNANDLVIGGINVWRSTDGGAGFNIITQWTYDNGIGYVHADIHDLAYFGNNLYCGSDGSVSRSTDNGNSWTDLTNGIVNMQFYGIHMSQTSVNKILGGSQDNGTNLYTGNGTWEHVMGADGMNCLVDYVDNNTMYGTIQFGVLYKSTNGFNSASQIFQSDDVNENSGWVAGLAIDPNDHNTIYIGYENVYKSTDAGATWSAISNFSNTATVYVIAVAPSNSNYIYVVKHNTVYRTTDGGASWSTITSGLPNLLVTDIAIDPNNPQRIWASLSGYDTTQRVYSSEDAGNSWSNYSTGLPAVPANTIEYLPESNDGLYVGMDMGVYYIDNTMNAWEGCMAGIPNVIISDIEIACPIGKIRAATYGRGAWEADIVCSSAISITKSAEDGTDTQTVNPGGTANFEITVTNTGAVGLENVAVTDLLVPSCDNTIGSLAAGESISYTCSVSNVLTGFINTAAVTGSPTGGGDPVSDTDDTEVILASPAISITKSAEDGTDTQTVNPGGTANFEITVTNTGAVGLENVAVTDLLVPSCDNTIGSLAAGESISYTCSVSNVLTGFINTAAVTGSPTGGGDPVSDTDDTEVILGEGCPEIGTLTSSVASVCPAGIFDLAVDGLTMMDAATNDEQDFGIEFVYFVAATTDPYTGGTSLGVVPFVNLSGTTAILNNNTIAVKDGYVIYAILNPAPADGACRPAADVAIAVEDNVAPVWDLLPGVLDASYTCGEDVALPSIPTASDNCSGSLTTVNLDSDITVPDACSNGYVRTLTYVASDDCGNLSTSYVQTITITDSTAPVLLGCPVNTLSLFCGVNSDVLINAWLSTVTATDNCGGAVTVTNNYDPADLFPSCGILAATGEGLIVTFTGTDGCGNEGYCYGEIVLRDIAPPSIGCPVDLILECGASTDPAATGEATASDDCSSINVSYTDVVIPACSNNNRIERTWMATDACNNQVTCMQIITIVDTTPPVLSAMPGDITINCEDGFPADLDIIATDNCGEALTVSYTPATVCTYGATVANIWTATDCSGNTTTHTRYITILDDLPPDMLCQDITLELNEDGSVFVSAGLVDAGSSDPSGISHMYVQPDVLTCLDVGGNNVTLFAVDNKGNLGTCMARVTITDNVSPELICKNFVTEFSASGVVTISTADVVDSFNDDCGSADVTLDQDTFTSAGIYAVTVSATDDSGNITTCEATVEILDGSGCPEILILNADIPSDVYQARDMVVSAGNVLNTEVVDYKAGVEIDLLPGFDVERGAEFCATIEDCSAQKWKNKKWKRKKKREGSRKRKK